MPYWLHVNHPTDKARIHTEGGCRWVIDAVARAHAGMPYGLVRLDDRNGYWEGPFSDLAAAQTAQASAGKKVRDQHC